MSCDHYDYSIGHERQVEITIFIVVDLDVVNALVWRWHDVERFAHAVQTGRGRNAVIKFKIYKNQLSQGRFIRSPALGPT